MSQLNKNYIKYISDVTNYWTRSKNNNIYLNCGHRLKRKPTSKCTWISTCMIRGRLKKTYKNNKVSRHFIRDESKKKLLNIWSVKTW